MAVSRADVVGQLFDLGIGEVVHLEAESYAWSSPFQVGEIEEIEWDAATDGSWRTRSIHFKPTDARGSPRNFDVVEGGDPPETSSYGPLAHIEPVDNESDTGELDWLERPAEEIVDTHAVRRTLEEVLDTVEDEDEILDVHQRFALDRLSATRHLLWQLGLRNQSGQLLEEPTRQERIDAIREVYL